MERGKVFEILGRQATANVSGMPTFTVPCRAPVDPARSRMRASSSMIDMACPKSCSPSGLSLNVAPDRSKTLTPSSS